MRKLTTGIATVAAIVASGVTIACGVCIEDKIAATYDHAVIHDAIASHRQVIFVALEGRDGALAGERIIAAARRVPGMQTASVRYAAAPPAFSFAISKNIAPDKALAAFQTATKGMDVQMRVVRIMRDGALVDPPG